MDHKYFSEAEAAEYIKRKPGTLKAWRFSKTANGPKYNRDNQNKVVYKEADLIDFLEGK